MGVLLLANIPNNSAISAIFCWRFKEAAYSVNIFILTNAANIPNDSTKVVLFLRIAYAANERAPMIVLTKVAVFLPMLPTFQR